MIHVGSNKMKWIKKILGLTLLSSLSLGGCGAALKAPKVPSEYSCEVELMTNTAFSLKVGSNYGAAKMLMFKNTKYCVLMTPDDKVLNDRGCFGEADEDLSLGFPISNISKEDRATYRGYWEMLDMDSKIEKWQDIKDSGKFGKYGNKRFENKSCHVLE